MQGLCTFIHRRRRNARLSGRGRRAERQHALHHSRADGSPYPLRKPIYGPRVADAEGDDEALAARCDPLPGRDASLPLRAATASHVGRRQLHGYHRRKQVERDGRAHEVLRPPPGRRANSWPHEPRYSQAPERYRRHEEWRSTPSCPPITLVPRHGEGLGRSLLDVINDILDFSRSGRVNATELVAFDLRDTLDDTGRRAHCPHKKGLDLADYVAPTCRMP